MPVAEVKRTSDACRFRMHKACHGIWWDADDWRHPCECECHTPTSPSFDEETYTPGLPPPPTPT